MQHYLISQSIINGNSVHKTWNNNKHQRESIHICNLIPKYNSKPISHDIIGISLVQDHKNTKLL